MKKNLYLFSWLLAAAIIFSQEDVEYLYTIETADTVGVKITLSDAISYTHEVSHTPPQLKLFFPGASFPFQRFTEQVSVPPLYHVSVRERNFGLSDGITEVILDFHYLPEYEIYLEYPEYKSEYLKPEPGREYSGRFNVVVFWEPQQEEKTEYADNSTIEQFQPTVSLNFSNANLLDVLRLLAEQNHLNIIIGSDVMGLVTVTLTDVNLGTALDAILKVNKLSWFLQDDVVIIKPREEEMDGELITEVFKLEYVDGSSIKTALEAVISDKGTVESFSLSASGGVMGMGGMAGGTGGQTGFGGQGFSGALSQAGGLTGGGTSGGAGGMMGGSGGDHLLVVETYSNFPRIKAIIREMDKPVEQVNIAVKFIETKLTLEERLGINWSLRAEMSGPNDPFDATVIDLEQLSNLKIATLTLPVFTSILEILSTDNDTRLIQEPQVTTRNNTNANVTVGTTYPILIPESVDQESGNTFYSFEEQEISINLNVTPRINEGTFISMMLSAQVEALVGFSGPNADQPIVSNRNTSTNVTVEDGQTLLIGGLIFDQLIETETATPILSDIPLLKKAFTYKSTSTEQRELLIFITPSIVRLRQN